MERLKRTELTTFRVGQSAYRRRAQVDPSAHEEALKGTDPLTNQSRGASVGHILVEEFSYEGMDLIWLQDTADGRLWSMDPRELDRETELVVRLP